MKTKRLHILVALFVSVTLQPAQVRAAPATVPQQAARTDHLLQFTSGGHILGFAADAVYVASGSYAYRVEFVEANLVSPIAERESQSAEPINRAVPLTQVTYPNLWQGVTLTYDAPADGILRSAYRIEPNGEMAKIRLRYNAPVTIESDGALAIASATGLMRESAPRAWQEINGERVAVPVEFVIRNPVLSPSFVRINSIEGSQLATRNSEVGFAVEAYDRTRPLFIDPTLTRNTFLGGGSGTDYGYAIAVDGSGNVYVAGRSNATWGLPVRAYTGGDDTFAAKLDASGNLMWNTFLGGSGVDYGLGIAVDESGNVYVVGQSNATWGSPVRAFSGDGDAFAAKVDSSGNLTWNTFLGGSDLDAGYGIAVDGSGNVYMAGWSRGTWGSPVRPYTNNIDAFAAKLNSSGNLTWNTFLGSWNDDYGRGIAVDGSENVYVMGYSLGSWGSPVRTFSGVSDAFAVKLESSGNLTWNTFLGGSDLDAGYGIAVDGSGNVYVAGYSLGSWGSPVRPYTNNFDAFAAKVDSSGNLTWNTFLGGSGYDYGNDIVVDGSGNVYVAGSSTATWGLPVRAYSGGGDAFTANLDSSGNLTWNTFLGGSGDDYGNGIEMDGNRNVYVAGSSTATWGSPVRAYSGSGDAFAAILSPLTSKLYLPLVLRQ
jgi:hypothetical protein